jgi:nitrogen regulatory protein PII-like uncharacterized protein
VLEKLVLSFDDFPGHAKQRVVAVLQALDQPTRFLELVLNVLVVGGVLVFRDVAVHVVDPDTWQGLRVELDPPAVVVLGDNDVRDDIVGSA